MKATRKTKLNSLFSSIVLFSTCALSAGEISPLAPNLLALNRPCVGIFKPSDPKLDGLKWGNWGARPYEYHWAASVVDVKDKKIIDLGIGLPSNNNWYGYVVNKLSPAFYVGIDNDPQMRKEAITTNKYALQFMQTQALEYPNDSFDVAYSISTFHSQDYETFMKSIEEVYRVLKDNGVLVITFDERWDKNLPKDGNRSWNTLEQTLIAEDLFKDTKTAFGIPHLLDLVKDYFVLFDDDLVVSPWKIIYSSTDGKIFYKKINRDPSAINSGPGYNSSLSYVVLKKKLTK